MDHYLDVTFDLSKVLFIATANMAQSIPGPLMDRMETIRIPGYTMEEKVKIARNYVIPEQLEAHGITEEHCTVDDEALRKLIEGYTREAGVRSLKREIAALCRWVATKVASNELDGTLHITADMIEEIRGPVQFFNDVINRTSVPGVLSLIHI